jgi:hypothetical protein
MQNKLFLKAADICELLEVKQTSAYEIIVWPVAGVLFAALLGVVKMVLKNGRT